MHGLATFDEISRADGTRCQPLIKGRGDGSGSGRPIGTEQERKRAVDREDPPARHVGGAVQLD